MSIPMNRYKYIEYLDKNGIHVTVAVSSYAGRTIKGIARCNPEDTYNPELGRTIAAARCNEKIAMKRKNRAFSQLAKAEYEKLRAEEYYKRMVNYASDSLSSFEDAVIEANLYRKK